MCCSDLRTVKESQTRFRKASDDLDSALNKHVGAPKTKPIECDEAANQLLVSRSKFTAASLEYTDKVCWKYYMHHVAKAFCQPCKAKSN